MLQLPVYYILEKETSVGANVDFQKRIEEKQIVFVFVPVLIASAKVSELDGSVYPSSFYGQLPDY